MRKFYKQVPKKEAPVEEAPAAEAEEVAPVQKVSRKKAAPVVEEQPAAVEPEPAVVEVEDKKEEISEPSLELLAEPAPPAAE